MVVPLDSRVTKRKYTRPPGSFLWFGFGFPSRRGPEACGLGFRLGDATCFD